MLLYSDFDPLGFDSCESLTLSLNQDSGDPSVTIFLTALNSAVEERGDIESKLKLSIVNS
jgi:hypothetical protein